MGLVVVGSEWIGLFRMTMLTVMNNYVVLRPKSILNYKRSFRRLFHYYSISLSVHIQCRAMEQVSIDYVSWRFFFIPYLSFLQLTIINSNSLLIDFYTPRTSV